MADKTFGVDKGNETVGKYRDESDGTYSPTGRARLEGWDSAGAAWIKVAVTSTGSIQTSGSTGGGGGGPATIADAADTVEGALADAAIITDTTGTVNGKLRGLVKWAFERMPASLGQKTMAASLPVVLASDQAAVPVTANAGTNLNTSALALDATLTGGTQKAITRGGAKGATTAADLTGTAEGADHQALDVQVYHGGTAKDPTAIRALTSADVVSAVQSGTWLVNGDVDHDVVNTLKNVQIAGHASPTDIPPTAVSANGDRVRAWLDRFGSQVVRSRKIRESYTAVFRLAETAARLDQTFTQVANTNKQWATLHHAAGATKEVRLTKCYAYITSDTTAGIQGVIELRQISAAPATGNPAITPTPHRRGGTAAEAVALYLPTTAGTEANVNSPLAHVPFDTGISGAVSILNPVPILTPVVLYDAYAEDAEVMPPVLPVATLDGWAVMVRTVGAPVLRITVVMKFTEEIP